MSDMHDYAKKRASLIRDEQNRNRMAFDEQKRDTDGKFGSGTGGEPTKSEMQKLMDAKTAPHEIHTHHTDPVTQKHSWKRVEGKEFVGQSAAHAHGREHYGPGKYRAVPKGTSTES